MVGVITNAHKLSSQLKILDFLISYLLSVHLKEGEQTNIGGVVRNLGWELSSGFIMYM